MILQNGGGICDHEVGTGKTLIMCMAAHEMHRLGIANKPMIIALKANVSEIAATYQAAFPDDKILYASEKDFSPQNRVAFFNRIKNNDYACVIMSHDQFGKIPQSMRIQEDILWDEIRAIDEALDVFRQQGGDVNGRTLTGLEKRKDNLRAKIDNINYSLKDRQDDFVDFEKMGIDHIFIDESHQFKNLMFTTRHQRVSGLGNPAGSQKALNLLYAIRTIQKRTGNDLGATFLSGTTISNSLTELYLLFKYLRPGAMAQQGIHSFDAWAAVYAKKTADYEFTVTNAVVQKERFRYFVKVPELAAFYNEITDYRTGEDVGLDRPNMTVTLHNIKPTADQQDFNARLVEFAKMGDGELIFREPLTDREMKGKMLIATDASRKASLDMRLISRELFGDDPDNKASHCARLVSEYYQRFNEQKGTQFIFSDLSTYKPGEWNVFQEIKDKLVNDYGIPESEIRFIQEAKNEKQRKAIIQDMNDGKIRVLFGSTSMLGTGVNAQKRAVAVHHIDIPWRPSDLEQRNGRARRTGNDIAKLYADNNVDVIIYAVERTLDSYKFNLLQNKQLFITQLKTNSLGSRVIDEGAMDEENGMNFAEYVAILSGNDDLLQKARLEKKILALESERKTYMQARRDTEWRLEVAREKVEKNTVIIQNMSEDYEKFSAVVKHGEDGTALPGLTMKDVPEFTQDGAYNIEGMGEALQDAARTVGNKDRQMGTVYGFPLFVDSIYMYDDKLRKEVYVGNKYYVKGHYLYEHNNGKLAMSKENRLGAVRYGVQALAKIPSYIEQHQERNKKLTADISEYERIAGKPWGKEDDLKALKKELEALEKKIQESLDETVASMPKPEEPAYKIFKEGKDHKVTFAREVLGLVDYDEMSEAADTGSWRNRGYVGGWRWSGSHMVSEPEIYGEFSMRQKAEEWIKEMVELQKSRENDVEWLTAKAGEDTGGYMIHQDNEVIFFARKRLAELNGEEYKMVLPADVRQQLFELANKEDYHSERYNPERRKVEEARETLADYGIDWHTNLALDAVRQYIDKWDDVEYEDLDTVIKDSYTRLSSYGQDLFTGEERDFMRYLRDATEKRYYDRFDRTEAFVRAGIYADYLCDVFDARQVAPEQAEEEYQPEQAVSQEVADATVAAEELSTVRMQVAPAAGSTVTDAEREMLNQVAMDLMTGNHLLGRRRPDGYRELMSEVGGAFAAVEAQNVTPRQRDLLDGLAKYYHEGYDEIASQIGVEKSVLLDVLSRADSMEQGTVAQHKVTVSQDMTRKDDNNALRDALIERLRNAGIAVITDVAEGERILKQVANRPVGLSVEEIKERVGNRLTNNNYTKVRSINPFVNLLSYDNIPSMLPYRDVFTVPTLDDYYIATKADFEYIGSELINQPDSLIATEAANRQQWADMVASGKYEHQTSPRSNSEYLLDRETGDIYRFSNHWGRVASCEWSLDKVFGTEDTSIYQIGKSNIMSFKVNKVFSTYLADNPAWAPAYGDALQKAIVNYETLLSSDVEMTDFVRNRLTDVLSDYKKLFERYQEEGFMKAKYSPNVRYQLADSNVLPAVLSGEITRQEVERAMDSNLVKHWLKSQSNPDKDVRRTLEMFGAGSMLVHEFAKARLGIDNKFEPGKMFYDSWEVVENYLEVAKNNGLDSATADKYDLHSGSEDVKHIMEHPETMYSEDELAEIGKFLKPGGFEDFKAAVRSFSEAKAIQQEEQRIRQYNGGEALTKAFVLYDIAQRRLFAEHEGDERWFRRSEYIIKADGTTAYGGVNQQPKEGETFGSKWVLKDSVANELMRLIATNPVTEKVPLLEMLSSGLQRFDDRTADIRYMLAPDSQSPIFISNAWLALQKVKQEKATPEQWLKMLEKLGGIKAGEDRWTGLSQWLKDSQEKSLSKMDIIKYLHDNMINVEEVHYIEARSLEDSEQFRAYQREFDDIKVHVNDLYEAADNKYGEFIAEMTEKYGQDWMDQLTDDEDRQERYLLKAREDCDTSYHTPTEIAYDEMISRYGDDWGMAFSYYQEDGQLTIEDEDRAVYFLGEEVSVDRAIHDVRLQNTTKALTNKREIALTVPSVRSYLIGGQNGDIHFDDADDGRAIAWVRFGDTVDAEGHRVLVIDEIQSKRHQDGREKGYKAISQQGLVVEKYDDVRGVWHIKDSQNARYLFDITTTDAHSESEALSVAAERRYRIENGIGGIDIPGVPDAPFEKNWQELAMKRMLRYAAENGYDRVAWLNGQQQVERYDLSKNINFVSYNKETQKLLAGTLVDGVIDYDKYNIEETVEQDELSKFIGKDLAPKVLEKGILQGDDLRVGGDGMKAFYDEMLPSFMNKYGKQWGVHVEDMDIPALQREDSSDGVALHGVKVTEQMKQDVMQGQPMFFRSGEHQAYGFVHNGTIYIDPRIATAETPIHEYTHLWAEVLRQRNPEEWKGIVEMMKNTPEVWNFVRQHYPGLHSDDAIADEALAYFSGQRGSKRLQEMAAGKENAEGILDQMAAVLTRFWTAVADFFHIHFTNKEEVADRVLYDMLNGVNPLDYKLMEVAGLREQQEQQTESQNFKEWFGDWKDNPLNASKVVDAEGKPLVVEHGTHANFTTFDINHIGENSKDNGLFGAGFYFGTKAPGWLNNDKGSISKAIRLHEVEELRGIFAKAEPDANDVAVLQRWLNEHKDDSIVLYHGTDGSLPILQEGLKRTTAKTARSLQSGTGYVYLSVFPTFAKGFGQFAYPEKEDSIAVYDVAVKVSDLHIDKDQLKNKRMVGVDLGDSLAASLLVGHSATVKHDIMNYDLQRHNTYHVMKVYLDIKHPFEVADDVSLDIYSEIKEKLDSSAMRGLTLTGLNGKEMQVGEYIDHIKAVDNLIKENMPFVEEQMAQDEDLQYIHPDERLRVWREHEIVNRTGLGSLGMSWQVLISQQIGSYMFTAAAIQDGYDGVIVDRGEGYKEYIAFFPNQIKSATENIGTFLQKNDDIRYSIVGEPVTLDSLITMSREPEVANIVSFGPTEYMRSVALQQEVTTMSQQHPRALVGYENYETGSYVFVGNAADILHQADRRGIGEYLYGDDVTRNSVYSIPMSTPAGRSLFDELTPRLVVKGHNFAIIGADRVRELVENAHRQVIKDEDLTLQQPAIGPRVKSAVQLDLFGDEEEQPKKAVATEIPLQKAPAAAATEEEAFDPTRLSLRQLADGETCYVERRYTENGFFSFVSGEHIESNADVAYIFRTLEDKSVENSFICMVKDGKPTVIHLGIGDATGVMAPIENTLLAFEALKPEKVWFIHNHPSGSLKVSRQDFGLQQRMERIFGAASQPGIIINTTSGKYMAYTSEFEMGGDHYIADGQTGDERVKTYSFDKTVFSKEWNPQEAFKGSSPAGVAGYVSSHRLGEHEKFSLLVMNTAGNITGNVFLPWTNIKDICNKEGVETIARFVMQMGGNRCLLYGSEGAFDNKEIKSLSILQRGLHAYNIILDDVTSVERSLRSEGFIASEYINVEANYVREPDDTLLSQQDARLFNSGDIITTLPDGQGNCFTARVDKVDDLMLHYTVSNGYVMVPQSQYLKDAYNWRMATDMEKQAFLDEEKRVLFTAAGKEQQRREIFEQQSEKVDAVRPASDAPRRLTPQDREAGGAMVDHLLSMGITVHTDNRENRRVLREAQRDLSEAGKVRHFTMENGKSYGFAYKGELHLDMSKVNGEVPLHEYAHLWCEAMRRVNPANWENIVSIMRDDADTWRFVRSSYPELTDDNDLAEEVIAHYSGRRGAEKLQAELQRMSQRDANYGSRWGNIFQNVSKAIQDFWKHIGDSLNIQYSSKEDIADQILNDFAKSVNPIRKIENWLQERDKEYAAAVEAGDIDKARDMFWDALQEHVGNGITPFMAVDGYRGKLDTLAHAVKEDGNTEAINKAADLMVPFVRQGMVLVPAPGHNGYATSTLALANAIAERAFVPVADVLKSDPRESQYEYKYAHNGKAMSSEELGIRMEGTLPEGRIPVVIDNVVHSGNTAEACVKALGKGVVLSLASAVSQDRHVASLKSLQPVVYDKEGKLVPLSERFELKNKYLGRVMHYRPLEDAAVQEGEPFAVQGFDGYTAHDFDMIIRDYVNELLAEYFPDDDIYVKEVTVVGSRVRGEAREDSDLDILLEYGGEGVREDALFNVLNGNNFEIEGIPVDINPINAHYSLTTAEWLERDAQWREEDRKKHNAEQSNKHNDMNTSVIKSNLMVLAERLLPGNFSRVRFLKPYSPDDTEKAVIDGELSRRDDGIHLFRDEKDVPLASIVDRGELSELYRSLLHHSITKRIGDGKGINFPDGTVLDGAYVISTAAVIDGGLCVMGTRDGEQANAMEYITMEGLEQLDKLIEERLNEDRLRDFDPVAVHVENYRQIMLAAAQLKGNDVAGYSKLYDELNSLAEVPETVDLEKWADTALDILHEELLHETQRDILGQDVGESARLIELTNGRYRRFVSALASFLSEQEVADVAKGISMQRACYDEKHIIDLFDKTVAYYNNHQPFEAVGKELVALLDAKDGLSLISWVRDSEPLNSQEPLELLKTVLSTKSVYQADHILAAIRERDLAPDHQAQVEHSLPKTPVEEHYTFVMSYYINHASQLSDDYKEAFKQLDNASTAAAYQQWASEVLVGGALQGLTDIPATVRREMEELAYSIAETDDQVLQQEVVESLDNIGIVNIFRQEALARQLTQLKETYPDDIILFRNGKDFSIYGDDVATVTAQTDWEGRTIGEEGQQFQWMNISDNGYNVLSEKALNLRVVTPDVSIRPLAELWKDDMVAALQTIDYNLSFATEKPVLIDTDGSLDIDSFKVKTLDFHSTGLTAINEGGETMTIRDIPTNYYHPKGTLVVADYINGHRQTIERSLEAGQPVSEDMESRQKELLASYKEVKAAHPHEVVLFRQNGFMEAFGSDADKVANHFGLPLYERTIGGENVRFVMMPTEAYSSIEHDAQMNIHVVSKPVHEELRGSIHPTLARMEEPIRMDGGLSGKVGAEVVQQRDGHYAVHIFDPLTSEPLSFPVELSADEEKAYLSMSGAENISQRSDFVLAMTNKYFGQELKVSQERDNIMFYYDNAGLSFQPHSLENVIEYQPPRSETVEHYHAVSVDSAYIMLYESMDDAQQVVSPRMLTDLPLHLQEEVLKQLREKLQQDITLHEGHEEQEGSAMTVEQLQEKAVSMFGENFEFNYWNETEPGTKIDRIDLGEMPDTISVDRLGIKDGQLYLYSDDISSEINMEAMDAVEISKVRASLDDIKEYLNAHQEVSVSEDEESVTVKEADGTEVSYQRVHGWTHDDPALLYSNTEVAVYFYDSTKNRVENIDNPAGIDAYEKREGFFLMKSDEIDEGYRQLEEHDRIESLPEDRETLQERFNSFVQEHGEEPLYAEVTVRFKDDGVQQMVIIKLDETVDEKTDDKIFFNTSGLDGLLSLLQEDNDEDFDVIDVEDTIFHGRGLFETQEQTVPEGLSVSEMQVFYGHLARVKDALRASEADGGILHQELQGILVDNNVKEPANVRAYFGNLFRDITDENKKNVRDEWNKIEGLAGGSLREMAYAMAYNLNNAQIQVVVSGQPSEDIELPYRIVIGEDPRPGGVEGEFHVDFSKNINRVAYQEMQQLAEEMGGTMRVTDGHEWADFYSQNAAEKFANRVVALNADRISAEHMKRLRLEAIGYPFLSARNEDGSIKIATTDISLYWSYAAGNISLHEAAQEFAKAGFTNFVDEKYTREEFVRLNEQFSKLDADLQPLPLSEHQNIQGGKPVIIYDIKYDIKNREGEKFEGYEIHFNEGHLAHVPGEELTRSAEQAGALIADGEKKAYLFRDYASAEKFGEAMTALNADRITAEREQAKGDLQKPYTAQQQLIVKEALGQYLQKYYNDYFAKDDSNTEYLTMVREKTVGSQEEALGIAREIYENILNRGEQARHGILARYGIDDISSEAETLSGEAVTFAESVLYNKENNVEQKLYEKLQELNGLVKEYNEVSKAANPDQTFLSEPVESYGLEKANDDSFALTQSGGSEKYTTSWIPALSVDAKIDELMGDIKEKLPSLKEAAAARNSHANHLQQDIADVRKLIAEAGLEHSPLTPRLSVAVDEKVYAHAMVTDQDIYVYENRYDAYDDILNRNGVSLSELPVDKQQEVLDVIKEHYGDEDRQVTVRLDTQQVPEYALSAIVNGDFSGIEDAEDEKNIREFMERDYYKGAIFSPRDEQASFTNRPAFGLATDCVTMDIIRTATIKELRERHAAISENVPFPEVEQQHVDPELREAKGYLMDIIDAARAELGDTIDIEPTAISLAGLKTSVGYVFLAPDGKGGGEYRLGDKSSAALAIQSNGHTEFNVEKILEDYSSVYALSMAVRKAQIKNLVVQMGDVTFPEGQPVLVDSQSIEHDYVDAVNIEEDGKLNIIGHRLDADGYPVAFEYGDGMHLDGYDDLYAAICNLREQNVKQDAPAEEQAKEQVPSDGEKPKKKSRWDNIDYTKYTIPVGVKVENAKVTRVPPKEGEKYASYVISANVNGKHYSQTMYSNDIKSYYKKDARGQRVGATLDQLVAKYFGKQFAADLSIGSVQEAEHVLAEQKEAKVNAAVEKEKKAEQQQEKEKTAAQQKAAEEKRAAEEAAKKKAEEEKKAKAEKKDKAPAIIIQSTLLLGALLSAREQQGVWLNKDGKQAPDFIQKGQPVSAFNALMMALHSDANGYNTNDYTTFKDAHKDGYSVKGGESGLPFNWYNWDKYVNRFNANEVITKEDYEQKDPEEKELYKVLRTKEERSVFNIDQTTMPQAKREAYQFILETQKQEAVIKTDDTSAEKSYNPYKAVQEFKEKHPDAMFLMRSGDFYEVFGEDAKKASSILGITLQEQEVQGEKYDHVAFPHHALDSYLPKIIRTGQRVAICDRLENPRADRYDVADVIYAKSATLENALMTQENVFKEPLFDTGYDSEHDVLRFADRRWAAPGQEVSTALCRANDSYRAAVAYTGAESRLNRVAHSTMLPADAVKYDRLVQELAAGVLMTRDGLPATLSKESMEDLPYWQRELKESPKLMEKIERDVNNAVEVLEKLSRGEKVDYAAIRGEKSIESVRPKFYTIASDLATIPDIEKKHVVVVKDEHKKSAAVILPAGASLEVNNEVSGMNKNRFVIALRKEGYESVQFYNAGGALGLNQSNEFFADKTVEVAKLKQYDMQVIQKIDLTEEIARTSKVDIEQVQLTSDDKGNTLLYVKPAEGESFTVYAEPSDVKLFRQSMHTMDFDNIRETLGQKYYGLVLRHPDLKQNVLMPTIADDVDMSTITKVNIFKDRYKENTTVILATINGEQQKPVELSKLQAQRFWLVDDKDMYKLALAAQIWQEKVSVAQGQSEDGQTQFRDHHEGPGADSDTEVPEKSAEAQEETQEKRGGIRM